MSEIFASSGEVFEWLSRFINLERGQTVKSFRLERMEILAEAAGNPQNCAPVVHVAGSKGKGSVTGMMGALLSAAGYRTACYMSPHVADPRERISLGDRFFDEKVYTGAGRELGEVTGRIRRSPEKFRLFDPARGEGEEPTYFELLTLYFFLCARSARCDAMVVETGLGGRLDSTNIVDPLAAVITLIELEHTEFLGTTLAEIAGEKAGILKPGRPLALGAQAPEAREVFERTAAAKGAPLWYMPGHVSVENPRVHEEGTGFTLRFREPDFFGGPLDLWTPLAGRVQAENAGLAVLGVRLAFPSVDGEAVRKGLRSVRLPARFERVLSDPVFIIDGAHTERSIAETLGTFTGLYGRGGLLIFGCASGKNAAAMAALLLPAFSFVIVTTPGSYKKSDPPGVLRAFEEERERLGKGGAPKGEGPGLLLMEDTRKAIEKILSLGRERGLPILGTGSFYLAAEIRLFVK
jgi:dihydrofolate synthase/folylpolyglutamate synthase